MNPPLRSLDRFRPKESVQPLAIFFGIGLILIVFGATQFSSFWITEADLTRINGTLDKARTYTFWEFDENRRISKEIRKSHKSELIFQLKEYTQEYYLAENIGDRSVDGKYEDILRGLKKADSLFVWVKKTDENIWHPQIFQIDGDDTTLLKLHHLHIENNPAVMVMLVVGIFLIIIFGYALARYKYISQAAISEG